MSLSTSVTYQTRRPSMRCKWLSPPSFVDLLLIIYRAITEAPVIWSHSAVRAYNNISRNVPDYVLDKIGRDRGKVDGVVMVK